MSKDKSCDIVTYDIDEQLREQFALHKERFDKQEREARRLKKKLDSLARLANRNERI